jgi:(1->4)-alpha-D-glucan 1-alpha-D-glucosylmutase
MLAGHRIDLDGGPAPEPEMEWLFYQALAGVWPADLDPSAEAGIGALAERMEAYVLKVVREAKARTSWTAPAAEYETAVSGFVRAALSNRAFLADFVEHTGPLRLAGAVTSLAQLAIKLAAPGVPDIYQGTELWDLSLVDPDNRRPVDFALRSGAAAEIDGTTPDGLLRDWRSGRPKLRLMRAGLALRRERPELFVEGEYVPLEITGEGARNAVAFARRRGEEWLVLIATRLPLALLGESDVPLVNPSRWGDTRVALPAEARRVVLRDIVSGEALAGADEISLASALARFPATLLHGTEKVVKA